MRLVSSATVAAVAALVVASATTEAHAQAREVVVSSRRSGQEDIQGQGIMRRFGDACFVVTPWHVIYGRPEESRNPPDTIIVKDVRGRNVIVEQDVGDSDLEHDVVILTVAHGGSCSDWPSTRRMNDALRPGPVELARADPSGQATRRRGAYQHHTNDQLILSPAGITEGMSGSTIYMNDVEVGMLTRWDSTYAHATRLSYVVERFQTFFNESGVPPSWGQVLSSFLVPGLGQAYTRRRRTAVLWAGGTVLGAAGFALFHHTVDRTVTYTDHFGTPRTYPIQAREYPLRRFSSGVWVVSGALSFWEADWYRRHHYQAYARKRQAEMRSPAGPLHDRERGARHSLRPRVEPVLAGQSDGQAVSLSVELSF
jgi:hypothetical protein